ncbi:hypothetical protein ACFS6H_16510 [Terrimonas rubra]|uniref:Uncharacterized protein n=1 Tax=Terrimonas rubra TaxID=1035890 RepID=A0ABW6A9L7_9BACT
MLVKVGESRQDTRTAGTYNSVTIAVNMIAAAANTALSVSDFKPEQLQVKVILKRNGATEYLLNDNFRLLGTFNALENGLNELINGEDLAIASAGIKANKLRFATLQFGTVRLNPGDELTCEVTPALNMFGAAVNSSESFVDFDFNPCVDYEAALFYTKAQVVTANTTSESFNLGNNVTKVMLLNFDKDNLYEQVVNTLAITSDKYDQQLTFNKLVTRRNLNFPNHRPARYGAVPPTQSVFRLLDMYPQSFIIYNGENDHTDLSNARLDISFNGSNNNVSQNYVVYRYFKGTQEQMLKALQRQQKHMGENMAALPKA